MSMDPLVIDPPNFDQKAAWGERRDYVDKCGGVVNKTGEVNWQAAHAADPGVCSCPACGAMYWCWGNVQRCRACAFEYPTDWWAMYSWGAQAGYRKTTLGLSWNPSAAYRFDDRMKHPYYRYGFEHPVEDPWKTTKTQEWRDAIRKTFTKEEPRP